MGTRAAPMLGCEAWWEGVLVNTEDVIRMAEHAGFGMPVQVFQFRTEELERFATLVAAAEREACAKVCDARVIGDHNREDQEAKRCAAAIRARGEA